MTPEGLPSPPLVAILRGIEPAQAEAVGRGLYKSGFRAIEVPLNSPSPFDSISRLARGLPADCLVGAGTVLGAEDVRRTRGAGGRLVVAPNCNPAVIAEALAAGLVVLPGVATATEAFAALAAGARTLKLFPAASYGPGHLKALRAVLPPEVAVLPVGGVGAADLAAWLAAGAGGFGFGSELYRPGQAAEQVAQQAARLLAAYRQARGS